MRDALHEARNSLQFHDDLIEADKIGDKALLQRMTFIKPQHPLRIKWYSLESNRFQTEHDEATAFSLTLQSRHRLICNIRQDR